MLVSESFYFVKMYRLDFVLQLLGRRQTFQLERIPVKHLCANNVTTLYWKNFLIVSHNTTLCLTENIKIRPERAKYIKPFQQTWRLLRKAFVTTMLEAVTSLKTLQFSWPITLIFFKKYFSALYTTYQSLSNYCHGCKW